MVSLGERRQALAAAEVVVEINSRCCLRDVEMEEPLFRAGGGARGGDIEGEGLNHIFIWIGL